jgi:pimeloyl-ACP methyl ester carboxylesterase
MENPPTLVLVHGSWHSSKCYEKIIKILQEKHKLKCLCIDLPSMSGNPDATFKDDLDVAREAISSEINLGNNVVVIAHSYGGMVGNSAIEGFTQPRDAVTSNSLSPAPAKAFSKHSNQSQSSTPASGHVIGIILIASGFTLTGLTFMDPFFGHPPPAWRVNKETGFADLVAPPRQFFYHDLPLDEGEYWVSQLTCQNLKALFEGGEFAYAGWLDVPVWYIGTVEDQGLPVAVQRVQIGMAREMGATVEHREMQTSHSPFLSRPEETVKILVEAVEAFTGNPVRDEPTSRGNKEIAMPELRLWQPITWYRHGLPLVFGRILGQGYLVFTWGRRLLGSR